MEHRERHIVERDAPMPAGAMYGVPCRWVQDPADQTSAMLHGHATPPVAMPAWHAFAAPVLRFDFPGIGDPPPRVPLPRDAHESLHLLTDAPEGTTRPGQVAHESLGPWRH